MSENYFECYKAFKISFHYSQVGIFSENYELLYLGTIKDKVEWDKEPPKHIQDEVNRICKKEEWFNKWV